MKMPRDIGPIHFVGIGGIGMSGIARVLANQKYRVQGSDVADGANVQKLRERGINIAIGHDGANLGEAAVVVVSSAIKHDNPELKEARARGLPVVRRAEMLAELMRLRSSIAVGGTHGKTTTTSMVAALLDAGGMDPTVINGGIINAYGSNARVGEGEWMVVEADESDGTFVKLPADIAIVTNVDPEHLDHYGTFDKAKEAYRTFVENIPFYGFAVMCMDHPEVQSLIAQVTDRRVFTYGKSAQADYRLTDVSYSGGKSHFSVVINDRRTGESRTLDNVTLAMPGEHNLLNSTAAIAVAANLGVSDEAIRNGLAGFAGVKRRFTLTGSSNGIDVYDDYGHHPVEISAVLKAARGVTDKRVIAVMQPHRYTRLESLFDDFSSCFNDADQVVLAPVYEAGEAPIEGFDHMTLADGLRAHGHRNVSTISHNSELAPLIHETAESGDVIICLGAGSITQWAYSLPEELDALAQRSGR